MPNPFTTGRDNLHPGMTPEEVAAAQAAARAAGVSRGGTTPAKSGGNPFTTGRDNPSIPGSSNYHAPQYANVGQQQGRPPSTLAPPAPAVIAPPTPEQLAREQQVRVIQELQRQAAGDMNSKAQQQLSQGYAGAQAQQSSLGSSMRGQSAGAAMRGVQAGQQGIQRGLAGDQQMLKIQEQQAAQAMLAQLLGQVHGQDITGAGNAAENAYSGSVLDDKDRQFYDSSGITEAINKHLSQYDSGLADIGMGLDTDRSNGVWRDMLAGGAAGVAGTISKMGSDEDKADADAKAKAEAEAKARAEAGGS